MQKKYESFCESFKNKNHSRIPPHLYLNGRIFWCRFELPKVNGKRRFKRFSLRTDNYYEARQMILDMQKYIEKIHQLSRLYHQLKIEKIYTKDNNAVVTYDYVLSEDNDIELLKQIKSLYDDCFRDDLDESIEAYKYKTKSQITATILSKATAEQLQDPEYIKHIKIDHDKDGDRMWKKCMFDICDIKKTLKEVGEIIIQIQNVLSPQAIVPSLPPSISPVYSPNSVQYPMQITAPSLTIGKILTNIQNSCNNCAEELDRQTARIKELLGVVGLTLDDEYVRFHIDDNINKITQYVRNLDIKNDSKRARIRYLKRIMEYACNENSAFGRNLLNLLPKFPRTPKYEVESHTPYTEEELKKMFDPKYDFFKENPDVFWAVLIALFTGSRHTAAITLQYDNFPVKEGIQCIDFNKNHPIKKTKTDATVRIIPMHSKLIELGFLDYIHRHKKERKATNKDFIFPDCLTNSGKCTEHFFDRGFFPFLKELEIKKKNTKEYKDHHDFHSFRKNINKALEKAKVEPTYINDIIGWEGKDVRETNYSQHTIPEIKEQLEKLHYDFLEPAFAEWKKIMATK